MNDLHGLFRKCTQVRPEGGTFEITSSPVDFGIKSIHFQSKLMRQYTVTYPNLKIGDDTHKLSQYDFVFIVWSTVCCLMRTHIIGVTSNFSENSQAIIQGADYSFPYCRPTNGNNTEKYTPGVEIVTAGAFPDYFCPFTDSQIVSTKNLVSNEPGLKKTFLLLTYAQWL